MAAFGDEEIQTAVEYAREFVNELLQFGDAEDVARLVTAYAGAIRDNLGALAAVPTPQFLVQNRPLPPVPWGSRLASVADIISLLRWTISVLEYGWPVFARARIAHDVAAWLLDDVGYISGSSEGTDTEEALAAPTLIGWAASASTPRTVSSVVPLDPSSSDTIPVSGQDEVAASVSSIAISREPWDSFLAALSNSPLPRTVDKIDQTGLFAGHSSRQFIQLFEQVLNGDAQILQLPTPSRAQTARGRIDVFDLLRFALSYYPLMQGGQYNAAVECLQIARGRIEERPCFYSNALLCFISVRLSMAYATAAGNSSEETCRHELQTKAKIELERAIMLWEANAFDPVLCAQIYTLVAEWLVSPAAGKSASIDKAHQLAEEAGRALMEAPWVDERARIVTATCRHLSRSPGCRAREMRKLEQRIRDLDSWSRSLGCELSNRSKATCLMDRIQLYRLFPEMSPLERDERNTLIRNLRELCICEGTLAPMQHAYALSFLKNEDAARAM